MDRNEFFDRVRTCIGAYLPDVFCNYIPVVTPYPYSVLTFKGLPYSPSLDLDRYFGMYFYFGCDLEWTMRKIANDIVSAYHPKKESSDNAGDDIKQEIASRKKIVFQLMKKEGNEVLFTGVPHRNFLDLAVIYCLVSEGEGKDPLFSIITEGKMEGLGMDEEGLYQAACRDTESVMQFHSFALSDMMNQIMGTDAFMPTGLPMHCVTAKDMHLGANCMLFANKVFAPLAKQYGTDLLILPSSIHEVIVIPVVKGASASELKEVVMEVNGEGEVVKKDDILSDHVYRYSPNYGIVIAD